MTDRLTVRLVASSLAVLALAVIAAATWLQLAGEDVPGELWTLGGGALGALGSLLARTGSTPPPPLDPGT